MAKERERVALMLTARRRRHRLDVGAGDRASAARLQAMAKMESRVQGRLHEHASPDVAMWPRILVSHIPLHRPDHSDCGPLRGRRPMMQGYGLSYRNLLPKKASRHLLRAIDPLLILSGDDHDYCQYQHTNEANELRSGPVEITFCTFSWCVLCPLCSSVPLLTRAPAPTQVARPEATVLWHALPAQRRHRTATPRLHHLRASAAAVRVLGVCCCRCRQRPCRPPCRSALMAAAVRCRL